jgi:hypothetical protein
MIKIIALVVALQFGADHSPAAQKHLIQGTRVKFYKDSPLPQAVVLSVTGKCRWSTNGSDFQQLRVGDTLDQGAAIVTESKSCVDLFLRRMAITVRINPETEVKVEKMVRRMHEEEMVVETVLDLRKGRILCFVRGVVAKSLFEVKHASARTLAEGQVMGGFEVRADGASVGPRKNYFPLKIVSDKGVSVVGPGHKIDLTSGKVVELAATEQEETWMQLDELQALAELLSPDEFGAAGVEGPKVSSTAE